MKEATRAVQRALVPCEFGAGPCAFKAVVTPGDTPWEFRVACPAGHRGITSWAHAAPPPVFEAAPPSLFDGEGV